MTPSFARGGGGSTPEGAGGVFAAPGTEAFKQDFAKWEDLRRQATQALEQAEASLSKKLQAKQAKDRLAAGSEDGRFVRHASFLAPRAHLRFAICD